MDNILSLLSQQSSGSDSTDDGDLLPSSLIGLELDAGASGVTAGVDLLGSDALDVSVGLGALGSVTGLVGSVLDTGLGLVDDTGDGLLGSLL